MSNNRACKIAIVRDTDLANKNLLSQAVRIATPASTVISEFNYKPGEVLSDTDLAQMIDTDLLYFLYDASPDKKATRQQLPSLLAQIQTAKNQSGKTNPKCIVAGATAALSDEVTATVSRAGAIAKQYDFTNLQQPLCVSDSPSMHKFKQIVGKQAQIATKSDELFGKVGEASPNNLVPVASAQPAVAAEPFVVAQPLASSAQAFAPLSPVSTLIGSVALDASMQQGVQELDQAIKLAEKKLELQRQELVNLRKLQEQAVEVAKMFPQRDAHQGQWLITLKKFNETAAKILDGRKDVVKLVGGAIGVIVGIALLAASIPLYLFVPPLAVAGTTVAVNIIALCVSLVSGAGLTALGANSIYKGREQGVAQQTHQFDALANRSSMSMVSA
jgi:hypothetical protein